MFHLALNLSRFDLDENGQSKYMQSFEDTFSNNVSLLGLDKQTRN